MDINVGDTIVIEGKAVDTSNPHFVTMEIPGDVTTLTVYRRRITKVVPKPRLPKVGEIWELKKDPSLKNKVYYVDDTHVVYGRQLVYKRPIEYFLDHLQPETLGAA